MIANDKILKSICKNYNLVENYMQARFDKENKWELHHRRETDENKSRQQLIDEGKYYDVEPEELIFLTREEHNKLHHTGKMHSAEARKKISDRTKEMMTEEVCKRVRENTRKAMSKQKWYWWNNGIECTRCENCPGEGFVRGRL